MNSHFSTFFSLIHLESKLWLLEQKIQKIGVPLYDFRFEDSFACGHPHQIPEGGVTAIARLGAANDYPNRYKEFESLGIRLIHTPEQYEKSSNLPRWYPKIEDLTPRSEWFDALPPVELVESSFGWPVFIKGQRQTNRHQRKLSIIESPEHYAELCAHWHHDPILRWQKVVCRRFRQLRRVSPEQADQADVMPRGFEFRCFCWQGKLVGFGPYWTGESYAANSTETEEIIALAEAAALRLEIPFLVVDVAQTQEGDWIVIECNDGQDSGYAGVNRRAMWQQILLSL